MTESAMKMGFLKVAGAVPPVKPGDIEWNIQGISSLYKQAVKEGFQLIAFPELSVSGYSLGDLFRQQVLLDKIEDGLKTLLSLSEKHEVPMVIGLPYGQGGLLFNLALVLQGGKILGGVPKTYLPNTKEFYEQRWFASSRDLIHRQGELAGQVFPLGTDLIFSNPKDKRLSFALEVCEDLWAPIPPGSWHSLAGASLIINLSASNELVGKQDYRKQLVGHQSARNQGAYLYVSAGPRESTTDTVYSGRVMLYENGQCLTQSSAYNRDGYLQGNLIDVDFLDHERRNNSNFKQSVSEFRDRLSTYRWVDCSFPQVKNSGFQRPIDAHPFVPSRKEDREKRCGEIFAIQSQGLASRLTHIGCKDVVIGLSGGLDSTLALLVIMEAYEILNLPLSGIHGYTLPGFGTTSRTKDNITRLCKEFQIPLETVDIREACRKQLDDLNHSEDARDITYENVQARQRTQFLMNKSNQLGAIVIGTGDLSELALGWCTYNGDHMSMYAVNTGVPKTLVRYLVDYVAHNSQGTKAEEILLDICDTPISPELLPPDEEGNIAQKTEESVGPYELHDFFLYQIIRCGFTPEKVQFLAEHAFKDIYDGSTIERWLKVFIGRFFSQQFKRSCLPDGPKVGSLALSPRGDWRMPSDASVRSWLD